MKFKIFLNRIFRVLKGYYYNKIYRLRANGLRVQGKIKIFTLHKNTKLIVGNNVLFYDGVKFFLDSYGATIKIGNNTYINRRSEICCKSSVKIGKNCAISWDVIITDTDYHGVMGKENVKEVIIGDNVWIGCKSIILKGVKIGNGVIISAGSLITKDIPDHCMVGGVPAKIIKNNVKWK